MPGAGPPVEAGAPRGALDVDALLREALALLEYDDGEDPVLEHVADPAASSLRDLLLKEPHLVANKHVYQTLRSVISGYRGPRDLRVAGPDGLGPGGAWNPAQLAQVQALLLALVLAARLPLDGLLLAAQALFHVLPDERILALLRAMAAHPTSSDTTRAWKEDAVLALHHGLLASALALVPDQDGGDPGDEDLSPTHRRGQPAPAGPLLREAVIEAVVGPIIRVTLKECRGTSQRTKAAFKMLHTYLCTMTRWRRVPAELDEIVMLVSTSWEVALPGVREQNEAVLVQLHDLAVRADAAHAGGAAEALRRLRDTQGRWTEVLLCTSWRCKDKYLLLKVLAPRLGRAALLRDVEAVLVDGLLLGMVDPHLASAATSVYRVLLSSLDQEDWVGHCLAPIKRVLTGKDRKLAMNVLNYWIIPTVSAFPDSLRILLDALRAPMKAAMAGERSARSSQAPAAFLHLVKIGRKEGFWDVHDDTDEVAEFLAALQWGSHHGDAWVRALTLSAMCMSSRPRQPVTVREMDAALRFLEANAHADDTRLRHSLLESLGWLLMRVRNTVRAVLAAPAGDTEDNVELAATARFLADLHRFLLKGLQPGTNYQRRVTCLGVYRLLLSYLSTAPPRASASTGLKKAVSRDPLPHSAVLARHLRVGSVASRRVLLNCIMDPADDVRNKAAEVLALLPADAEKGVEEDDENLPTWEHVVFLCNSQLFFHAESGAVLGSVLGSWKEDCVQPLDLVAECERQLAALREDVLSAASGGSPLHGVLGLVRRLLPPRGPGGGLGGRRQPGRWAGTEERLLILLEANVELCLNMLASRASSDTAFNPSFAEMGEAIDSIVSGGQGDDCNDGLPLTLSPAHQLVLNCIWLNLKASCALASDLAEVDWWAQGKTSQECFAERFAERCARLPVTVLTRCRHKGAIEAAGAALQQVVKTLTEQSDARLRQLPYKLLTEFLHLLLEGSTAKGTSVSRRSAGMAILVHRVVLGDQQLDKPLLHECISCLFALLERSAEQGTLEDSQHDLPQTQALHFLRTLVADATLRVAMSPYLGQAALFCFKHLNSSLWSVRNASLQLFGALVPKIVGQGKSMNDNEEEEDTIVGCINFEDLVVRFNPLCTLLLEILESVPKSNNVLLDHAELIPALSLLARLSVSEVSSWSVKELRRFKSAFLRLLSSPIAAVRSLAAKGFSRLTPLMESAHAFEELLLILPKLRTENERFGVLTALKLVKDRLIVDGHLTKADEQNRISDLIFIHLQSKKWNISSYASQSLLISILASQNSVDTCKNFHTVFSRISSLKRQSHIGFIQWTAVNLKQIVTSCSILDLPEILDKSLMMPGYTDVTRTALYHASNRIDEEVAVCVLQEVLDVCLRCMSESETLPNYETFLLLNLVLKIVALAKDRQVTLNCDIGSITLFSQKIEEKHFGTRCQAVALPVISGLLMFAFEKIRDRNMLLTASDSCMPTHQDILNKVMERLQRYSCPDQYSEDFRLAAATALRFIGAILYHQISRGFNIVCESSIKAAILLLKSTIQLLQDEDSHVREQTSKFVNDLSQDSYSDVNSLECVSIILSSDFLFTFLGNDYVVLLFLWELLSTKDSRYSHSEMSHVENPFDHGSKNIFAEEIWIIEQVEKLTRDMMHGSYKGLNLFSTDEFSKRTEELVEDIHSLETLTENRTHNRVREELQESAILLQQMKIDCKFKILQSVTDNNDCLQLLESQFFRSLDNVRADKELCILNFSLYQ